MTMRTLQRAVSQRYRCQTHAVIAHTTKGKGVSFMENKVHWHHAPPNDEQLQQAILTRRVS